MKGDEKMKNYSGLLYYLEKNDEKFFETLKEKKELRQKKIKEKLNFIKELFLVFLLFFCLYCEYVIYHGLFYFN